MASYNTPKFSKLIALNISFESWIKNEEIMLIFEYFFGWKFLGTIFGKHFLFFITKGG